MPLPLYTPETHLEACSAIRAESSPREKRMRQRLERFLASMGDDTEEELRALLTHAEQTYGSTGEKIAAAIQWWKYQHALIPILDRSIESQYREKGRKAVTGLSLPVSSAMLAGIALGARKYRNQRLGQLTGRGAESLLSATQRATGGIIQRGLDNKKPAGEIVQSVRDSRWFSKDRAATIAAHELHRAAMAGAMDAWTRSGVQTVQWALSPEHPAEDECDENFDVGPVPIGTVFPSGVAYPPSHVNCMCELEVVK